MVLLICAEEVLKLVMGEPQEVLLYLSDDHTIPVMEASVLARVVLVPVSIPIEAS